MTLLRTSTLHALTLGLLTLVLACGDDDGTPVGRCATAADCASSESCLDGRCVAGRDAGMLDAGGGARDAGDRDAGLCSEDCGEGVCVAGVCCPRVRACGDACCGDAQACSFGRCVAIGEPCFGAEDCGEGYCELSLGDETTACGEATLSNGRCLSRPPTCAPDVEPDDAEPACVRACSFTPPSGGLNVVERYAWGDYDGDRAPPNIHDVRNSPIVINLDDDDCDGSITARDTPEIVVITSPDDGDRPDGNNAVGDLVVLAVTDGELREKWRAPRVANPWTYPAAGDVDGLPGNEIVVCSVDRRTVRAFRPIADGSGLEQLWESPMLERTCTMPSLADLDQDGDVEVVVEGGVLDGATGALELAFDTPPRGSVIASDVDGDAAHRLEVVTASQIFAVRDDGLVQIADTGLPGNFPLVAQLDGTGPPEIVGIATARHTMTVWRWDPDADGDHTIARREIDINGSLDPTRCAESSAGRTGGGGPPTAGDVNADGVPDIAVAGGVGYAVLDGARLMDPAITDPLELFFWTRDTIDCSSAQTGSSVFDFNGDDRAEVLYADEHRFFIFEGATGEILFETCNTNGTIQEQPIVADVDADGQADIVVVANARYRLCLDDPSRSVSGVRVFGSRDGDWVRTRRVWNQHAYHITNIGEDGRVPREEAPNWADPELNDFRLNRQPGNALAAADVVVGLAPQCVGGFGIVATVRNLGEAVLPPGARVRLYRGPLTPGVVPPDAALLGTAFTTRSLYPAQAEELVFALPEADARPILFDGTERAHAIADVPPEVRECRPGAEAELSETCTLL